LHFGLYVFIYVFILIPSKLWAIATVWDNDWRTSNRYAKYHVLMKSAHVVVWLAFYFIHIGYYLSKYSFEE